MVKKSQYAVLSLHFIFSGETIILMESWLNFSCHWLIIDNAHLVKELVTIKISMAIYWWFTDGAASKTNIS